MCVLRCVAGSASPFLLPVITNKVYGGVRELQCVADYKHIYSGVCVVRCVAELQCSVGSASPFRLPMITNKYMYIPD